jgi:hypothetical protein
MMCYTFHVDVILILLILVMMECAFDRTRIARQIVLV